MTIQISQYDANLTYLHQKKFDCRHTTINKFVHNSLKVQVNKQLSQAYVLTDDERDDQFVGFYTIVNYSINLNQLTTLELGSLPKQIPCTRLIMLGVDTHYQGQQLGKRLMQHALTLTKTIASQIGCYGMYLDADHKVITMYQQLGFTLLDGDKTPHPSPMFIPLSAIP